MKNILIVIIVIILIILGIFLLTNNDQEVEVEESAIEGESSEETSSLDYLDMQGYHLYPPSEYNCEGGFTEGYRYLDAECVKNGRSDYRINVEAGLASSGINWEEGKLTANQIVVRSFEFTGGQYGVTVCEEFYSENLNLDAEHYLCNYLKDGKDTIVIGIGKSFYHPNASFGRWFEAELVVEEGNDNYEKEDYIGDLVAFLNSAIKIDWNDYTPDN